MIWCELAQAPELSEAEQRCCEKNWSRVILEGRKPGQTIGVGCDTNQSLISEFGQQIFDDLLQVADVLDESQAGKPYRNVCEHLKPSFANPELTLSARVLQDCLEKGLGNFAMEQAENYKQQALADSYKYLTFEELKQAAKASFIKKQAIEDADNIDFETYLFNKNQL